MVNVAITDDHPLILNGITEIIESTPEMRLSGAYLSAAETQVGLEKEVPDVLLLDINLPDGSGLDLCKIYTKTYPSMRVIALTTYNQALIVKGMIQNGASGYLLKNTSKEELISAINAVQRGEQYLQEDIKKFFFLLHLEVKRKRLLFPS